MKPISFNQYKMMQKLPLNAFNKWMLSFWNSASEDGRQQMKHSIDDSAAVYTEEQLYNKLTAIRGVGPVLADRILKAIMENDHQDEAWDEYERTKYD